MISGVLMGKIKLPSLLGYIGVGIGLRFLRIDVGGFDVLAGWGGMFLFFLIGLEMRLSDLEHVKGSVVLLTLVQILIVGPITFGLLYLVGISGWVGILLAISLTFSSTILAVTNLAARKALQSFSGRMVVGSLLIQDLIAIILMSLAEGRGSLVVLSKGVTIALLFLLISIPIASRVITRLKLSAEELILVSLAWCLIISSLFSSKIIGMSIEIGAFLAGLSLSKSFVNHHIANKVRTLRDFFVVLFFVSLGMKINWKLEVLTVGILLGVILVITKILVSWLALRFKGFTNRLAMDVSFSLSSASEFALIIVVLAVGSKLVSEESAVLISTAVISSIVLGSVIQMRLDWIYSIWGRRLVMGIKLSEWPTEDFVLLVGCHRMGQSVLGLLKTNERSVVVLDQDPEVIRNLLEKKVDARYADAIDPEVLSNIPFNRVSMVISTINVFEDNLFLLREIRRINKQVKIVIDAETLDDANRLYEAGADYTVFPHFVGGIHLAEILEGDGKMLEKYRERQQKLLVRVFGN